MIHVFINALSASAGGGLTYVRNVVPLLAVRNDVRVTLFFGDGLCSEIRESDRMKILEESYPATAGRRFWYEQRRLPELIRRSEADVLLSTGNFALYRSPVPQILLSRNALYASSDFRRDLRQRGDYRLWIDNEAKRVLAKWSVQVADCTIAPSATFADDLRRWTGKDVRCIHHGFDHDLFLNGQATLSEDIQAKLATGERAVRVLFVSHYNYYRNFETLIRAVAIAKGKLHPRRIRLILTCKLESRENPGVYRAEEAAGLVRQLKLCEEVVELGAVSYSALHNLYKLCDVYATPAYAETFAHPLVEAMASGLPVIASDLKVHREICGVAAEYFPRFASEILAEKILGICESEERKSELRGLGLARSRDFSWSRHVEQLLSVARSLAESNGGTFQV
jgi:glycosyltransferase involved in cell wall biosynthesis